MSLKITEVVNFIYLVRANKSPALKFTYAQIASMMNSFSKHDNVNFHLDFLAFSMVKFPKMWHKGLK